MSVSRTVRPATADEEQRLLAGGERLAATSGTVEVLTVEVTRYAVGEECNAEGPILFLDVGQNELLVLWGQWLYDPHVVWAEFWDVGELWERNAWFKHFELVRSPSSGLVLSLKPIGHDTVRSAGTVGAGQRLPPQPSGVFQGSLDALMSERPRDPTQMV